MAYDTDVSTPGLVAQKNGTNGAAIWIYKSADGSVLVAAADYFSNGYDLGMKVGDQVIVVNTTTGGVSTHSVVTVTTDGAASVSGGTTNVSASGAAVVDPGIQVLELDNVTAITATIADASKHAGIFVVTQLDAGTAGHTLTLTAGQFNVGGDNVATLNAAGEALAVLFDSAGNGTIIANTGAVVLS